MEFDATKIKIIFMGTPEFALLSLTALINAGYDVVAVVTNPDKKIGREQTIQQTPVKRFALDHKLKVLTPQKIVDIKKELESIVSDLIVVSAYGRILPPWTLALPRCGALNVHPSLLPRWRGASPIPYTILDGDGKTGVTIMQMNEKMDEGAILASREFSIFNFQFSNGMGKPTAGELLKILADLGAKILIESLPKWINGEINPVPQNNEEATYSKILVKEDGHIIWTKPAQYIERQIRAFNPWPGTFCYMPTKKREVPELLRLKILDSVLLKPGFTEPVEARLQQVPGTIIKTEDGRIAAQTGSGLLLLDTVQLEGRKPVSMQEFMNGYPNFIGTILQ